MKFFQEKVTDLSALECFSFIIFEAVTIATLLQIDQLGG
jgi:hypothetical protein